MKNPIYFCIVFCSLLALGFFCSVFPAFAGKSVSSPYVSKGEIEVEAKSEYLIDDNNDVNGSWEQSFEVGYGLSDSLAVEAGIEFEDAPGSDIETSSVEMEATVQFTEKGFYFIDSGVKFGYSHNLSGGADKAEAKLLLAHRAGQFRHTANLEIEKEVGDGSSDHESYGAAWKTQYAFSDFYEAGLEYYGDFADLTTDYSEQEHLIGPVAYGELDHGFEYDAGVLIGISKAAPDATLKLNLEYGF